MAYEVKDADGKLIFVAVVKPLHLLHIRLFCLSAGKKGLKLYAVSATGDRTEVTMN